MAQKDFDLNPEHRAQLPKTDHWLGHDFMFTSTCAQLLPFFHTILNSGETVEVGADFDVRTMPLSHAAFTKIDTHVEYFFVPMQLIYQKFSDIEYNIREQFSSMFDAKDPNYRTSSFPLLQVQGLQDWLILNRTIAMYNGSDCLFRSVFRLFDMLAYNPYITTQNATGDDPVSGSFFPYALLAYNAIYQYCYRLDTHERFKPIQFNWDQFFDQNYVYPGMTGDNIDWHDFLRIKDRPVSDDYFTSVKVSPIVDVLNLNVQNSLPLAQNWLSRSSYTDYQNVNTNVLTSGSVGSNNGNSNSGVSPLTPPNTDPSQLVQTNFGFTLAGRLGGNPVNGMDINTANIRAMFANEKLWSITGRARKTYDDQTLAHFGYQVPHDVKHEVTKIGHDHSVISIGEVISTASTTGAPLGEIAGKGYGSQQKKTHKFTAPCHGVLMFIWSATPRYRYLGGFGRWNIVTNRTDLYTPEYDHLGMQPLYNFELFMNPVGPNNSSHSGWQFRYEQWKRRYDRCSLAFDSGVGPTPGVPAGPFYSWAMGKLPLTGQLNNYANSEAQAYKFYYHSIDLNQIFLAQYNPAYDSQLLQNPADIYINDPLVVDMHVNCNLVSTMSKYSLPRLDD